MFGARVAVFATLIAVALVPRARLAEAAPKTAAKTTSTKATSPSPAAPERWCLPDLDVLPGDVCVASGQKDEGPRTLVVFLHGVIAPNTTWQWTQHLAVKRAAEKYGFVAALPPAPRGVGPEGMREAYAWPTAEATRKEREGEIVRTIESTRRRLEEKAGKPFDEVFVMGFSSGAYYATSLALRGRLAVDGYGVFAGGAAVMKPALAERERRPIYVGVCSKDDTTNKGARGLGGSLATWGWPYRMEEQPLGHMFTPEFIGRALHYLQAKKRDKS